jgi:hypothetical protein
MEVRRALADLAEVRGRLATVQRFDGYSGTAAIVSGAFAVGAGLLQRQMVPHPFKTGALITYLLIWLGCLVAALAINYGAIAAWRARHLDRQTAAQMRTVGMTILPAIAAGGVLTLALTERGYIDLLPGMWCAVYALGLFASRAMVPREVVYVAIGFGAAAAALLLLPGIDPLAWWVMPAVFGGGQIIIGLIVRARPSHERNAVSK